MTKWRAKNPVADLSALSLSDRRGMTARMDTDGALNLIDLVKRFPDSDTARTYLESVLWPSGPVCHHCGTVGESTKLEGRSCRTGL